MTEAELWTIGEVAAFLKSPSAGSARGTLSRWGVKAIGHTVGDDGKARAQFRADDVRAAAANRLGRGRRTDLYPVAAIIDGDLHRAHWNDDATVTTPCGITARPELADSTIPVGVGFRYCPKCMKRAVEGDPATRLDIKTEG